MLNADKPGQWKEDIARSVDYYNEWFLEFAPRTFRASRRSATEQVTAALESTNDLEDLAPVRLKQSPQIVQILRMCTAPPLARDRLVGLADASKSLVKTLEDGKLPMRTRPAALDEQLRRISDTILLLLDRDIFPWLGAATTPDEHARLRAATIIADRLTGANADPIIRNAQERRQLALLVNYLEGRGYVRQAPTSIELMEPGTYYFRYNVRAGHGEGVNIPIDAVIQPAHGATAGLPILIEAKSAGDFTNPNKRRKEEAQKINQLRERYGPETRMLLLLCGYFDAGYLGYEASEGLDWIWEHRITDLSKLGV